MPPIPDLLDQQGIYPDLSIKDHFLAIVPKQKAFVSAYKFKCYGSDEFSTFRISGEKCICRKLGEGGAALVVGGVQWDGMNLGEGKMDDGEGDAR